MSEAEVLEVGEEPSRPTRPSQPDRADLIGVAVVALAALAWATGLRGADPAHMTDLGLVSMLSPPMVLGLLLLTGGFVAALRRDGPGWLMALHVVVFLALIHGTPAVLYGTLRYSWAWKHTGIVEFITRTGSVDTTLQNSPIYQSWPGFFALSALLTELVGTRAVTRIAMWAPLAFNLANLTALGFLFSSLGVTRRLAWLAIWIFFISNWVGQDYFSPQAMAFCLYLVLLGVVLRGYRLSTPTTPPLAQPIGPRSAAAVAVLLLAAMASSHQITPVVAVLVLTGLVVFRQVRGWYLPVAAAAMTVVWAVTVGRGVLDDEMSSLLGAIGRPLSNAEETLDKAHHSAPTQQFVSQVGRLAVVAVVLLAAIGLFRLWRSRRVDPVVLIIVAAPVALPLLTEFGGEVIFRVFLFAVPGLALLAAAALDPASPEQPAWSARTAGTRRSAWSPARTAVTGTVLVGLLSGFVVAYYGKDQQYYFSEAEISTSQWLLETAPPGSLIIDGSRNYPNQFLNYERFTYVTISREPTESWERVVEDPVDRLGDWLDNPRYPASYLVITKGMKHDMAANGPLPATALDSIEDALRASPRFRLAHETADGVVFNLAPEENR